MNKAHALLFALMMMTVSLAGCFGGDDGDSNDETPSETLDDWQVHFAASSSDLPECNDDTNGRLYYIEADVEFQVCKTSGWEVIDISGTDGVDGSSSTSTLIRVLSSTSCITGGNTFEIGSDSNSDGVLDVSEVGITVDICNGSQGPEGPQGPAGADGSEGVAGTNGTNGTNGQDGAQGVAGANGTEALNALVNSISESAGNNCANGGTRIDVGVDDNADGVLSATEIDQTQYVCNGGSSNNTLLTSVTSVAVNLGCDAGGRVVSYGLDNGDGSGTYANGVLESGEVDASTTFCSRWFPGVLKDINIGSGSSSPGLSIAIGNTLYFVAYDGINGYALWKSDGTVSGTMMVKDIDTSGYSNFDSLTAVGNTLYFAAYDGTNGSELWKSDGTTSGTMMVKDIYNGSGSSNPEGLKAVGNTLYFQANDGTNGTELWKSDGTNTGTMMVKDINNGSSGFYWEVYGGSPWTLVSPGCSNRELTAIGNMLYFQADDGIHGCELWKSDGTANGTIMFKNINSGNDSSYPSSITAVGNTLYFFASDGTTGKELWKSDGTTFGTIGIKDINSGNLSSVPLADSWRIISNIGNTIYFQADDGTHGIELWKSDGTTTGTMMVKDINSGDSSNFLSELTVIGNTIYFAANDGTNGTELWKSDGTNTGTMMVKHINQVNPSIGNASSFYLDEFRGMCNQITAIGNNLYFQADDGIHGCELWKSDGTANGTFMVDDIVSGYFSSTPRGFVSLGNNILFTATHETRGTELFIYNYEVTQVITYS